MSELDKAEWENLKSQNATSSWQGRRTLPFVSTEHGDQMDFQRRFTTKVKHDTQLVNYQFDLLKVLLLSLCFAFTACSKDDKAPEGNSPITLSCDYFSKNENAVLAEVPNAPIDYIIACKENLKDHVTIEPGVTIAFEKQAGIKVSEGGSLNAVGTSQKPITFTATEKQKGWWGGVEYFSTHDNNELSYAVVEYTGATLSSGLNVNAAVTIGNSASLELTNSTLQKSSEAGLFIAPRGVSGSDKERVDAVKLQGNTYTENKFPMTIPFYMVGHPDGEDDYSGNEQDLVFINSRTMGGITVTMEALNVPYRSIERLHIFNDDMDKSHLIIEPGVELEMASGSNFIVFNGSCYLTAIGTVQKPIIIRGAEQHPGTWQNIRFRRSGPADYSKLEHVKIVHARNDVNNHKGALNLDFIGGMLKLALNHVHFSEIAGGSCPIVYKGKLDGLTHSDLSDDDGLLPACI